MEIEAISPLLEYKEKSKLREICIDVHKKLYGKDIIQNLFKNNKKLKKETC